MADQRLSEVDIGSGRLAAPDTGPLTNDLDDLKHELTVQRLLDAKIHTAELAMHLWSLVYDPAKQAALARQEDNSHHSVPKPASEGEHPAMPAARPVPQASDEPSEQPLPVVYEIMGAGGRPLRAKLLIPYVGEITARVGTTLPGKRNVLRIDADGVVVNDPTAGPVRLAFGQAVPLRSTVAATNTPGPAPRGQPVVPFSR
jgi:type IV pilus biogenesis protein PilP